MGGEATVILPGGGGRRREDHSGMCVHGGGRREGHSGMCVHEGEGGRITVACVYVCGGEGECMCVHFCTQ